MKRLWFNCAALTAIFCMLAASVASAANAPISFNQDIRLLFSDNCYACHGPDKNARKAKLRLDIPEGAFAKKDDVFPIVPGKPDESEVIKRLLSKDPEEVMPPPKSGKTLKPEQIELIRKWIAQGAKYEGHWAFTPPKRPIVPDVKNKSWPLNPIDAFILARLEKEGLNPSPEAHPKILARRASLDLVGIPPEPDVVKAFTRTNDSKAYDKSIDLLLKSPHYGERIAVHWLDLARYADTVGFHGDATVSVWPYRDYVIQAFNDNMPFDQFTREQLAGDLLPNATAQQKVASTFNRLNRMSAEGGIQDKEYLAKYAADRVRTVSTTWMGSTMACAECHDHKFDPFSTKDFYAMEAFFADLKEKGFYDKTAEGDWGPSLTLPSPKQKAQLASLDEQIKALKKKMDAVTDQQLAAARTNWQAAMLALDKSSNLTWRTQQPLKASTLNGATLTIAEDYSIAASGKNPDNETYTVSFKPGPGTWHAFQLETLKDEAFPGNQVARAGESFIVTELELDAAELKSPRKVKLAHVLASAQGAGFPALAMLDGRNDTGWSIKSSRSQQTSFHFAAPLKTTSNTVLTVRIRQDHYERKHTIGKFKLALSPVERASFEKSGLPDAVLKALRLAPEKRKESDNATLASFYRRVAPELTDLTHKLGWIQAERTSIEADIPSTLISEVRIKPRTIRVLPRGDWMNDSGEIVQPAAPHFLKAITTSEGERATRLDLANWLASKDNPLTARAFVNRLWKMYFGTGLSRTLDDLGVQGEWPTHPDLLDWLATEFMESGWDVKHLVRLMVTSRTYRQSSGLTPELLERDPQNRLLARQSRLRLDAELVRDNALAISGLLVDKLGGPSVRPYQPEGLYAPLNFPKREYVHDRGDRLYRRSLYTHWQRTFPHPSLIAFDAPGREECTALRVNSNTPLQSLVLLNDPIYVEAARVFAQNVLRKGGRSFTKQLEWAYQRALARSPKPEETKLLGALYENHLARYKNDPAAAREVLSTGEAPVTANRPAHELAAWTSVARAILNLNETITRN